MIKNTQRKELDNRPSISRVLVLIAERTGSPPRDMAFNGQLFFAAASIQVPWLSRSWSANRRRGT